MKDDRPWFLIGNLDMARHDAFQATRAPQKVPDGATIHDERPNTFRVSRNPDCRFEQFVGNDWHPALFAPTHWREIPK